MLTTRLLIIAITTTAIIAAVTTVSLSAATPTFAKINCNESPDGTTTCVGGTSHQQEGLPSVGGHGGRFVLSESGQVITNNGGSGANVGSSVGGFGFRLACDPICTGAGNGVSGFHAKGPGGNSGNVPPQ
jgi:hypothetical protein